MQQAYAADLDLILLAINARADRPADNGNGEGLFRLASQSGLLVPAPVLSVMSAFLRVVIAGTIAGDSVAGDAAWGNLRYLLVAKAVVAGVLIWACRSWSAWPPWSGGSSCSEHIQSSFPAWLASPAASASTGAPAAPRRHRHGLRRLGFTALLALGTLFSTLTDTATNAIGATVGVYIVSEIPDDTSQPGQIRYAVPTHYLSAWRDMFIQNSYPTDMLVGLAVQVAYLLVFGAVAIAWFRRKDIPSRN